MPISQSFQIFSLIKSLTKAEKRNFRIYAKRIQDAQDFKFLRLFDLIDGSEQIDDQLVLMKMNLTKSQFSNLKRHLYTQIIASLRMLHKEKNANFKVREFIDYAYILYGKGLYVQALKILKKASDLAKKNHLIYMLLTIVELEKLIETRHITRSGVNRALDLIDLSEQLKDDAQHIVTLSNLRIQMHAKYIKNGHVRNEKEAFDIKEFYHSQIANIDLENMNILESIYYVQSRVWYYFILLDFELCMKYAIQWMFIIENNPAILQRDVNLYMRGIHYVLTSAFNQQDVGKHAKYLEKFENFRKSNYLKFNPNSRIISFLYVHTARLNNIILSRDYQNAEKVIASSLKRIKRYAYKLDDHKILVFYFKFAWIYLCNKKIKRALHFVNLIINNELKNLRHDLQNYTRVLLLICHYELNNFEVMNYVLKTSENFFGRKKDLNPYLELSLEMFSELNSRGKFDHKMILKKFYNQFTLLKEDVFERRAFWYLDMISWLDYKAFNKDM